MPFNFNELDSKKINLNLKQHLELPYLMRTNHYKFLNQEINWTGLDNEENYKKNKKSKRYKKTIDYYEKNPIKYKINNFGFRGDDFQKGESVNIYLGCSITFGTGIDYNDLWVKQLNDKIDTDTKIVNLAQGGCGIENQFRHFYNWKDYFKIKNIFHFQPLYVREDFISDDKVIPYLGTFPLDDKQVSLEFQLDYFGSDVHLLRKYVTNILAIQNLAKELEVPYYFLHDVGDYKSSDIPRYGRDLMHPSKHWNKNLSEIFYKKYINNDTYIDLLDKNLNTKESIL